MTDENHINELMLESIRNRDRATLTKIYKETYPVIEKYILKNSGSKMDAQDIFQDALYLFLKKVEHPDFELTAKPGTFLFGVSKNLWLKQLTKKQIDLEELEQEYELDSETEESNTALLARVKKMKACLDKLGEPCQTILEQFYFLGATMVHIAEILNYTNANNAKNQKYKCFIRLKKMVLESNKPIN